MSKLAQLAINYPRPIFLSIHIHNTRSKHFDKRIGPYGVSIVEAKRGDRFIDVYVYTYIYISNTAMNKEREREIVHR